MKTYGRYRIPHNKKIYMPFIHNTLTATKGKQITQREGKRK
jgi:hypothetical protein